MPVVLSRHRAHNMFNSKPVCRTPRNQAMSVCAEYLISLSYPTGSIGLKTTTHHITESQQTIYPKKIPLKINGLDDFGSVYGLSQRIQFLSASPFEQGEGSQPADIQSQRRNCPRIIIPLMQTAAEPSSKHGKEQNLGHDVPPHLMQIHPSVRSSPRGMSMSGGMITNAEPNPVRPKQDSQARQPVPGTKTIPSSSNRSGRLNQPDCTGSQVPAGPPLRFHLVAIVAARLRDDATDL